MSEQQNQQTAALGTAPVGPLLFRLALPTITAQVVNLLYSIVDRIYIGRIPLEGKLALTGMGVTFPVITLISAFAALIGMGGAPRASIALGAKEHDRAERILGTCTAALWALALVLTALFLLFQAPLLKLFGASADTLPYAMQYLNLYVLGTVFVMTSLGLNGFITAQGRSSVAMKTVVIGAVLNTVLDPLFIFVLKMGVRGAAVATIISQAVSAAWVLRFLTGKQTVLRLKRAYFRIDRPVLASAVGLGASPFVMQSTESLLTIAFNVSLQKLRRRCGGRRNDHPDLGGADGAAAADRTRAGRAAHPQLRLRREAARPHEARRAAESRGGVRVRVFDLGSCAAVPAYGRAPVYLG